MGTKTKSLYDTDFAEWSARTAELVRAGRLDEVDLEHVAEEIGDLGKNERRAVRSQLKRMLMHMLKQRIQPERDGTSRISSIEDAREEMLEELEDSPSLRPFLEENLQAVYQKAVRQAIRETGATTDIPEQCPYTLNQILSSTQI